MNTALKIDAIKTAIGPQGRMLEHNKNVLHNVFIDDGKTPLWYGDLNLETDSPALEVLSKTIKDHIFVRTQYFSPEFLIKYSTHLIN